MLALLNKQIAVEEQLATYVLVAMKRAFRVEKDDESFTTDVGMVKLFNIFYFRKRGRSILALMPPAFQALPVKSPYTRRLSGKEQQRADDVLKDFMHAGVVKKK